MSRFLLVSVLLFACAPKPVPPPAPVFEVPAPVDPLAERPVIGPSVPFIPPTPEVGALSNGAKLWVVPRPGLPLVSLVIHVPGGSALDPKGHEGAGWLSDRLMTQGSGKLDAKAFSEVIERLGVQLEITTELDGSYLRASMKKDQWGTALAMIADVVMYPNWSVVDFKRERELAIGELTQAQQEPPTVAARMAQALWYGAKHPWGHPAEGTVAGMAKVTVKDVQRHHKLAWTSTGATITIAGDITRIEAQSTLEGALGNGWKQGKAANVEAKPAPAEKDRPLYLIDTPGAAQTMFYVTFPGRTAGAPELSALRAGTIVLGGTFTSRLNALLREKKGYTYGAKARTQPRNADGTAVVFSRIRTDVTGPAMADLLGELKSIQAGITPEELGKAKGAFKQDQVEAMESCAGAADAFAAYQAGGFGENQLALDLGAMQAVTAEQVKAEMAAYDVKNALFMLVGDKAKIEAGLKEAGISRIEVVEPE